MKQHILNFQEILQQILKGSRKFLQLSVGVSTQYDEKVMEVVDSTSISFTF